MKLDVDPKGGIVLREVFSGVRLETRCGNALGVCMRDDTLEINVISKDGRSRWWRADFDDLTIEPMGPPTGTG